MKYLLHIDTATDTGIVAIAGDGVILASRTNTEMRNHASTINNMISDVLAAINCALQDISAVVVCGGPGSYTGLRIGMATAKGLCYALDIPLLSNNRLTMLAYQLWAGQKVKAKQYISLILAREREFFAGIYDEQFNCVFQPKHILQSELQQIIPQVSGTQFITNAPADVLYALNISDIHINFDITNQLPFWAQYAFQQFNANVSENLATTEPFYLKQVYTHK
jgi:tRNA threonylcarbamoyladenosine biosynthesis protein TsaB